MAVNHVVLTGRIGRDPELRHTGSGKAIANFGLAVDRRKVTGDQKPDPDWIDCVAWESLAELLCGSPRQGQLVAVVGRLQTRTWDSNGQKRKAVEVLVHEIQFLSPRADQAERSSSRSSSSEDTF